MLDSHHTHREADPETAHPRPMINPPRRPARIKSKMPRRRLPKAMGCLEMMEDGR